jgi:hypothetical protein
MPILVGPPPQLRYSTAGIQSPANATNSDDPDGLVPILTFPWQLHLLLDDADIKGFSHVVSWLEGGTMFKVHKPKEFADRVMPCYFNQTRYKSFQRQLNSYRFHRFVAGKNKGTCFHELFMRDKPDLCRHVNRVKVNRGRQDAAQQQEAHAIEQLNRRMFEPAESTYPSGHSSKVEKDPVGKACDVDQDSSSLSSARGIPCWCVDGENRTLIIGGPPLVRIDCPDPALQTPAGNMKSGIFDKPLSSQQDHQEATKALFLRHEDDESWARVKISNCIPPDLASEIVKIFGSHEEEIACAILTESQNDPPVLDEEQSCGTRGVR